MQANREDEGVVATVMGVVLHSGSLLTVTKLGWRRYLSYRLTMCSLNCLSLPRTVLLCGQADMSRYSRSLLALEKRERVGVQTRPMDLQGRGVRMEFKSSESVMQGETTSKIVFKRRRATRTG